MNVRLLAVAAATTALALACADRPEAPSAPQARRQTDPYACDFNATGRAATKYFQQPTLNQVRDLLKEMQASGAQTGGAVTAGYAILSTIEATLTDGSAGSPSRGSDLVNGVIACMYDVQQEYVDEGIAFPVDFTVALDPTLAGGFGVRGPADDDAVPVLARGAVAVSGVAPQQNSTWSAILSETVLIFGFPVNASTYDWSMVRPTAAFGAPGAIVGLCPTAGDLLVHESSVGLLPYQDAYFLPDPCPTAAAPWGGTSLFAALRPVTRLATSLLVPGPLHASSLFLNPGGVGGLAGGLRSEFSTQAIASVDASFLTQPGPDGIVNEPIPPAEGVQVLISAGGAGFPSPTTVRLIAVDNNGAPEPGITCPDLDPLAISPPCVAVTGMDGVAWFGRPVLNKSGAYRLETFNSQVVGRTIAVIEARSEKFNIRP